MIIPKEPFANSLAEEAADRRHQQAARWHLSVPRPQPPFPKRSWKTAVLKASVLKLHAAISHTA